MLTSHRLRFIYTCIRLIIIVFAVITDWLGLLVFLLWYFNITLLWLSVAVVKIFMGDLCLKFLWVSSWFRGKWSSDLAVLNFFEHLLPRLLGYLTETRVVSITFFAAGRLAVVIIPVRNVSLLCGFWSKRLNFHRTLNQLLSELKVRLIVRTLIRAENLEFLLNLSLLRLGLVKKSIKI